MVSGILIPSIVPVYGKEIAPRFKAHITNDYQVWYDDEPHLYYLLNQGNRIPLISVTTLLSAYSQTFKEEEKIKGCARKKDYTAKNLDTSGWSYISYQEKEDRIRYAWAKTRDDAAYFGTQFHAMMEGLLLYPGCDIEALYHNIVDRYQQENPVMYYCGLDLVNRVLPMFDEDWVIYAEPLIYDLEILSAGQSDVVAINHKIKEIRVLDFKTNEVHPAEKPVYNNMEGVLSDLPQSDMVKYCLQTCLYQKYLLKMFPGYTAGMNTIMWANRDLGVFDLIDVDPSDYAPYIDLMYADLKKHVIPCLNYS